MSDDIIRVIDETYRRVGRIESRDVYGNLEWKNVIQLYQSIYDLRVLYTGRNYTTGTVYDASGTRNDAIVEGNLGTILLFNDHATFEMDGNTAFRANNHPSMDINGEFTVGAWVYLYDDSASNMGIVTKGTANQIDYELSVTVGTPILRVRYTGGLYGSVEGNTLKKDAWYSLTGRGVSSGSLELRVNRINTLGQTFSGSVLTSTHPLMIGQNGTEGITFFGLIALPYVSGSYLVDAELDTLYYRAKPFFGNPIYNDPDTPIVAGSVFGSLFADMAIIDAGTFGKSFTTTSNATRFISGSFVGGTFAGNYGSFSNVDVGFLEGSQISLGSGSLETNPALRFQADGNTGLYQPGTTDVVALTAGGVERLRAHTTGALTGVTITGSVWAQYGTFGTTRSQSGAFVNGIEAGGASEITFLEGSQISLGSGSLATNPALRFQADGNTGLYQPGTTDVVALTAGGVERLRAHTTGALTGVTITGSVWAQYGTFGTTRSQEVTSLRVYTGTVYNDISIVDNYTFSPSVYLGSFGSTPNNAALQFQHDTDTGLYQPGTTNTVAIATGNNERIRFSASGTVLIGKTTNTASGGILDLAAGISFPATPVASTNANTLDDYEEGTFTPTIRGTTIAGTGTYFVQDGFYVKIGRNVFISIILDWSDTTGTGNLAVGGIPFTPVDSDVPLMLALSSITLTASRYAALAYTTASSSILTIAQAPTGGGSLALIPVDVVGKLYITGWYRAA